MITKRLISLSKDQATFNRHKTDYEDAMRRSGYKNLELVYRDPPKPKKRRRRKSAIFFNAPFCLSVKSSIGKEFLKIVDRHFNPNHPYHSIFNRKTIKLSYSCMTNIGSIIRAHNTQVLENTGLDESETAKTCNCTKAKKSQCPLQQKCLTKNVIYKAVVKTSNDEKYYVGSTGRTFKERYAASVTSTRYGIKTPQIALNSPNTFGRRDRKERSRLYDGALYINWKSPMDRKEYVQFATLNVWK